MALSVVADVCIRLVELAAKRLEANECVSGLYDAHADEVSLGEHLYRLENLSIADVDVHRNLYQRRQEGLYGFVVCREGEHWLVLGASTWGEQEDRPVPMEESAWSLQQPLWHSERERGVSGDWSFVLTPRLRPSILAARLAA